MPELNSVYRHREFQDLTTLAGYERGKGLGKMFFEPPFLAATLCAVAAGVLMGAHALARFGLPRRRGRAFALGARALVDPELPAEAKAKGFVPEGITAGHAGFMLLLGDMMSMTYDEFAGPVEREKFPHNREDFENDLENE